MSTKLNKAGYHCCILFKFITLVTKKVTKKLDMKRTSKLLVGKMSSYRHKDTWKLLILSTTIY